MADLKKLALGRKGFQKGTGKTPLPSKPAKKLEQISAEEVGEVEASFRQRLDKEDKRRKLATDSEFWCAIYFQSREEKAAFLRRFDLDAIGDKYLDGRAVERALSRKLNSDAHKR